MKELKLDLKPLLKKAVILAKKDLKGKKEVVTGTGQKEAGTRKAMFGTKGFEFEKFRDYSPGDDASRIDWIASLRAQKPLVRVYSEEQNKDIFFFLDVSSSMSYSSHEKLKNEYAAELIATISFALSDSGDNLGLVMFTDRLVNFLPAATGREQFLAIIRELTNPEYYEGDYNLGKALAEFINLRKRPAMIMIISDFIGLKPGWEKILEALAWSRYDIAGIMIRDPLDDEFPKGHFIGQVAISDPFGQEQILMEPNRIAKKYKEYNERQKEYIKNVFKKTRSSFLFLQTNRPFIEEIRKFLFVGR